VRVRGNWGAHGERADHARCRRVGSLGSVYAGLLHKGPDCYRVLKRKLPDTGLISPLATRTKPLRGDSHPVSGVLTGRKIDGDSSSLPKSGNASLLGRPQLRVWPTRRDTRRAGSRAPLRPQLVRPAVTGLTAVCRAPLRRQRDFPFRLHAALKLHS
jgi:hypothetical protein